MIMPVVIICILLIVIMNLYLHDEVVMNSIAAEAVYCGTAKSDMIDYVQTRSGSRSLYLPQTEFSCRKSLTDCSATWKSTFTLPAQGLFQMVMKKTSATLTGGCKRYPWNMTQVLRIKSIIDA